MPYVTRFDGTYDVLTEEQMKARDRQQGRPILAGLDGIMGTVMSAALNALRMFPEKLDKIAAKIDDPTDKAIVLGIKTANITAAQGQYLYDKYKPLLTQSVAGEGIKQYVTKMNKKQQEQYDAEFNAGQGANILADKYAGMPLWGWLVAGVAVVGGAMYLAKNKGAV